MFRDLNSDDVYRDTGKNDYSSSHPIQSDLEFAFQSFLPCLSAKDRERLFAVHRRAIRAACGAHYCADVDPLYHSLKLCPLDHRFLQLFIKFIFQCKVAHPVASLDSLFCRHSTPAYTTRGSSANNLSLCRYKTACGYRSLSSRIALLWNALPFEMKSCNTSSAFNAHLACLLNAIATYFHGHFSPNFSTVNNSLIFGGCVELVFRNHLVK